MPLEVDFDEILGRVFLALGQMLPHLIVWGPRYLWQMLVLGGE